jgi:alkylation response protein AidB-like acyl-CoA dehydrogenase
MDFDETPEEAAFRAEVRQFLTAHATPSDGEVLEDRNSFTITDPAEELRYVQLCRDWQRTKYEHGWAGITWPKEYGGRGGTGIQDGIFGEEEAHIMSASGVFAVSIGMAGPTLIAHGTEEQ